MKHQIQLRAQQKTVLSLDRETSAIITNGFFAVSSILVVVLPTRNWRICVSAHRPPVNQHVDIVFFLIGVEGLLDITVANGQMDFHPMSIERFFRAV